ncbi:PadR family transcriptional regulator [Chloroflexus sp.]|uniref:PadR family transcriptional regulator n=1 Tax=Chloroflexus sp. TaxID=1904827 RepID=UPI002ACF0276|nr:PadR family transcriptional regulator [Chloroflexus sp.]
MSSQKQPLTIELALLGFVRQQPIHPYELFQQVQARDGLGCIWRIKQSHLYAILDRLEAAGYLSYQLELQASRPPRKILSLTEQGEAIFAEWLSTPVAHGRDIRLEFLAKYYFARREGKNVAAQLLARQIDTCREWLGENDTKAAVLPATSFERVVLQYRTGQLQAVLAWLEGCRQTLAEVVER